MAKVSVLIPARNEPYLQQTILEVICKAIGDVEVIVALDGYWPDPPLPEHARLKVVHSETPLGMRKSIMAAASFASGKYLMKLDAHCALSRGYDEVLQVGLEDSWVTVPRFFTLNAEAWAWQDEHFCDYFYLSCPMTDPKQFRFSTGGYWRNRTEDRLNIPIDDAMIFHGSCWMMSREHFFDHLGGLDNAYGTHGMEPQEICFKTWLGPWDGRVIVNKKAWNAHMHKGRQRSRGYWLGKDETFKSYDYCARYWMANNWPQQKRELGWLIDKFSPVPTWPDNWRELYDEWKAKDGNS
jgi:glycosyltransferase involved in cell wall biosynthesis